MSEEFYTGLSRVLDQRNDMFEELTRLRAQQTVLVEALTQIEKGEGEFSRDPLEHCSNTVESMKDTARKALATLHIPEEL